MEKEIPGVDSLPNRHQYSLEKGNRGPDELPARRQSEVYGLIAGKGHNMSMKHAFPRPQGAGSSVESGSCRLGK